MSVQSSARRGGRNRRWSSRRIEVGKAPEPVQMKTVKTVPAGAPRGRRPSLLSHLAESSLFRCLTERGKARGSKPPILAPMTQVGKVDAEEGNARRSTVASESPDRRKGVRRARLGTPWEVIDHCATSCLCYLSAAPPAPAQREPCPRRPTMRPLLPCLPRPFSHPPSAPPGPRGSRSGGIVVAGRHAGFSV